MVNGQWHSIFSGTIYDARHSARMTQAAARTLPYILARFCNYIEINTHFFKLQLWIYD